MIYVSGQRDHKCSKYFLQYILLHMHMFLNVILIMAYALNNSILCYLYDSQLICLKKAISCKIGWIGLSE